MNLEPSSSELDDLDRQGDLIYVLVNPPLNSSFVGEKLTEPENLNKKSNIAGLCPPTT